MRALGAAFVRAHWAPIARAAWSHHRRRGPGAVVVSWKHVEDWHASGRPCDGPFRVGPVEKGRHVETQQRSFYRPDTEALVMFAIPLGSDLAVLLLRAALRPAPGELWRPRP